jgi:hypothetical protein
VPEEDSAHLDAAALDFERIRAECQSSFALAQFHEEAFKRFLADSRNLACYVPPKPAKIFDTQALDPTGSKGEE